MEDSAGQLTQLIIEQTDVRLFKESIPRIKKCLEQLDAEQIWWRPNDHSNSIGNLVLHLCGNVRQWILAGLDGQKDVRKRQLEFDEKGPVPKETLVRLLTDLETDVRIALKNVRPDSLTQVYDVQIYKESGVSILVHVIEHFSYHTGQIAWITKMILDEDLRFYGDTDLG